MEEMQYQEVPEAFCKDKKEKKFFLSDACEI